MVDDQHGKISKKAYEIWDSHGRPHGKDEEHWAAAVKAVEAESATSAKPSRGKAGMKPVEAEPAAESAPAKKPRGKAAAKTEVSIPESAKAEPVATEAERHVELPVSTDPDMPKPKRGKAAEPVAGVEKKPGRTKKA